MSAAVLFSALVALTLSPVIAAKLLHANHQNNPMTRAVDSGFQAVRTFYQWLLTGILHRAWIAGLILGASLAGCVLLYKHLPKEYAPDEDRGTFLFQSMAPRVPPTPIWLNIWRKSKSA